MKKKATMFKNIYIFKNYDIGIDFEFQIALLYENKWNINLENLETAIL